MRIAALTCVYPPYRGGIGHAAERQARLLSELGHTVDVFTPTVPDGPPAGITHGPGGISVHRLRPWFRYNNSAFLPTLAWRLARYDAVWAHYPFYGGAELALMGCQLRHQPYVMSFHMDVIADGVRGRLLAAHDRLIAGRLFSGARAVVVSSRDYLRHSSLARRQLSNIVELPYGVDTKRYSPASVESAELRALGLQPERPVIAFVGGMDVPHTFKGVPVLLRAFAASGLASRAQLALVGDGELRPEFEREAGALGVAHATRFFGRASEDDLIRIFRSAAVTVLPSTSGEEAFGIVLIEAMACGSPVIASDLPGVRTVVGLGNAARGLLVPPGDVHRLSDALAQMVDDHAAHVMYRDRALVAARGVFSSDQERRSIARILQRLGTRNGARA